MKIAISTLFALSRINFLENGEIRVSLYKALLFVKIAQAIKGGLLNFEHSYKYRSLDDYLIPKTDFLANREVYLQRADLTEFAD